MARFLSARIPAAVVTAAAIAVGLLAPSAYGAPSSRPVPSGTSRPLGPMQEKARIPVAVIDYGWHTGLVLPVTALGRPLASLPAQFPQARYLIFGWGNRRFYEAASPGSGMALMSLFPSASVVFVQGITDRPESSQPSGGVRWLCVSGRGIHRLDVFLSGYFRTDADGRFISAGHGASLNGRFFASTGTYDALHTCNTWTTEALHAAGLPVDDRGIIFAGQVMSQIRALHPCAR